MPLPRRPRIQLDGVPLHIVQRGHNREPCFFGEEDYASYLHWLGEALGEAQCTLQGPSDKARQAAYRALFRAHLDQAAIDDIRRALNQNQPLGNARFHARIERLTGRRREARARGRPRLEGEAVMPALPGQGKLEL